MSGAAPRRRPGAPPSVRVPDPRVEASEADLAGNAPVVDDEPDGLPAELSSEGSEADILEQLRAEPIDDEEERR